MSADGADGANGEKTYDLELSGAWRPRDRETFQRDLDRYPEIRHWLMLMKGWMLVGTGRPTRLKAAMQLFEQVLRDSKDPAEVAGAHAGIARYYERIFDAEFALQGWYDAMKAEAEGQVKKPSAHLSYAELVLRKKLSWAVERAWERLETYGGREGSELDRYRLLAAKALIGEMRNDIYAAPRHARAALQMIAEPGTILRRWLELGEDLGTEDVLRRLWALAARELK